MHKKIVLMVLLAAILLAACGSGTSTTQPTKSSGETASTASGGEVTPAGTSPTKEFAASGPATCKPAKPFEFPAARSGTPPFAPITASDWVKGPENATMTIIEYSDFT